MKTEKDYRITEIIYDHPTLVAKIKELSDWVNQTYKNSKNLVLVGLLKGSIPFLAELIKHIKIDHIMDFMTVSSFEGGVSTTGNVKIIMDLKFDIESKDVLIVEEVIDSGLTLSKVVENLKQRKPNSLRILTLLDKKSKREFNIAPDAFGFDAPDLFFVGFGLDIKEKLRNLPYIGVFDIDKINEV